jgi:hypothetical protein
MELIEFREDSSRVNSAGFTKGEPLIRGFPSNSQVLNCPTFC